MSERTPIIWCCPVCQRSFDVGCCPEHTPLEHGVEIRVRKEPYTPAHNVIGAAAHDTPGPRSNRKVTPMDDSQDKAEPRYTLDGAQRELALRECALYGHAFDVLVTMGSNAPTKVVCTRCGASWKIATDEGR